MDGRGNRDGKSPWSSLDSQLPEATRAQELRDSGSSTPDLFELDPQKDAEAFRDAIQKLKESNKYSASVYVYDVEEYRNMRLFSTEDGTAGIALKPDGDIVSGFVYADSPHKRAISSMLSQMVELGGDRLDAFDTVLPGIYANSGFKPVARVRWDNEFAPDGWDKETYSKFNNGEPDVVIMAYDSDRVGSEYDPTEGEVFDDYDAAMEARNTELEELKKEKEPDLSPDNEYADPGPVSRERPSFDAGISDFEVDDSELETGEEEDLSSAVKLKRLIANNPGLSRFINRMAKAPVRNPVKTLQSARDLKKALADLDVSDFEVEGFTPSVSHSGMSRSDINLIRDNLSANNITVSPEEARDLADILNYVINFEGMTTEEAVIAALKKDGIRYSNKNNIAVKSVDLPIIFENEDSKELPDPKTARLVTTPKETKDILAAMGKINAFFESEGSLPGTLDPNAISIRVVPNQNAFDNLYNLLDITETGRIKSRATTFGANIPNLVELPVEEYLAGRIPLTDNRDLSSNIILNLKFLREYADKTKFESGSRIQETLIHEFGHTLHRSFGLSWGRKKTVSSLGEYYSVFKQFVSDYGTTSPKEHFSDSFSQYLLTGDSPQGWKAFMKSQGILK